MHMRSCHSCHPSKPDHLTLKPNSALLMRASSPPHTRRKRLGRRHQNCLKWSEDKRQKWPVWPESQQPRHLVSNRTCHRHKLEQQPLRNRFVITLLLILFLGSWAVSPTGRCHQEGQGLWEQNDKPGGRLFSSTQGQDIGRGSWESSSQQGKWFWRLELQIDAEFYRIEKYNSLKSEATNSANEVCSLHVICGHVHVNVIVHPILPGSSLVRGRCQAAGVAGGGNG